MTFYVISTLTVGGVFALLALSLNLAWGMTGMVNLGLAGFFAVGAYASAIATTSGAPILAGFAVAVLAGIIAGLIVTFSTLRLRDDYLAIVTLGFGEVVRLVALNERWLTNGADGISGIPGPFREQLGSQGFAAVYLVLTTLVVGLVLWLLRRLDAAPYGRVIKALREDQELARFAGKPVLKFKFEVFALAAAIASIAGALYGHLQSYISPDHFQVLITIYIFLAVTAGGVGRPAAAVAGAYAVVIFLETTRFLADVVPWLSPVQLAALREVMVGAALLIVLIWRPRGFMPETTPIATREQP